MTTVGVNVGDEFIREGICSFIDHLVPSWRPFYVNKHDLTTLHTRVYDESALLADKFKDADIIIQAGAPVYWKIGASTSYSVEWAEELWRKRIFRLGPDKPILNVAAGACQPYPDTVQTFLADPRCVDFANRAASACCWTSVRDPLAAQILLALGHAHVALPCSAFHAARRFKRKVEPENIIGINLMPMGGHFRLREDVDENVWRETIAAFLAGARRHHRLLYIAHDQQELSFMESLRQGDEQVFYSADYRDYFPAYAGCQAVVANRVHGAVCAAGFGTPSIIIGNDTRLMIGDFIGLPSYYVAEATAGELLGQLDALLTERGRERDRLLTLREESARIYTAAIGESLAAAGIETASGSAHRQTGPVEEASASIQSIHRTMSSFARRLSLDTPDLALARMAHELLSRPESRSSIRGGAAVLVIGTGACPLAWFLASLGAQVTLAVIDSKEPAAKGFPAGSAHIQLHARVGIAAGKIALQDNIFDMALACVDRQEAATEALRLLRPTGTGIMPANSEVRMIGPRPLSGEGRFIVGSKALPLKQKARVLIPRFDTFGDIVILEAFLSALRRKFPDAELCLLVRKGYDELAGLFPSDLRLRWMAVEQQAYICPDDQRRNEFLATLKSLAAEGWDAVLATAFNRTWLDDLLLEELAGVDTIMLGSAADARRLSTATRTVVPADEWSRETEKYRVLLEKLTGDSACLPPPRLEVRAALAEEARRELARLNLAGTRFVACLPAGTQNQKHKVWPLERYAEVLGWLGECHGLVPLLIGHEREETPVRSLAGMLAAKGVEVRTWLGHKGGIPMLAALLQQAALFVGNDSGPMHIAAALNVPVVGVFGGGTYPRFVPASDRSLAVVAEIPCFGCYWQCIFGDAPCIRLVDAASVRKGIELVMENDIPAGRVLHAGARLPIELAEIIEQAKAGFGKCEQNLREALHQERENTAALQASLSWRLTAPLRKLLAACSSIF